MSIDASETEAAVLAPVVDQLGWSASEREVSRWIRRASAPDGPFAAALAPGALLPRNMPLLAAEVHLERDDAGDAWLRVREAVVVTNPARVDLDRIVLRVVAGGRGHHDRDLVVLGAWVDGVAVPTSRDGALLTVPLPRALPPGHRVRLLVHLAEPVPRSDARQVVGTDTLWPDQTGSFAEDDGYLVLGGLLPVLAEVDRDGRWDTRVLAGNADPADGPPALFRVVVSAPAPLTVAATGVSVGRIGDERLATELIVAADVRDFSMILVPDATVQRTEVGGTALRMVVGGDDVPAGELLRTADDVVRSMSAHAGPLAQREIDVVEGPARAVDGLDWPGLVLVDASHKGRPYHRSAAHEWALAHGLGHQWWGHEVGNDGLADPWFDEGFATHASALYWEDLHGREAVLDRHEVEVVDALRDLRDRGVPEVSALLPTDRYDRETFGLVVHQRTALFLDLARQAFGAARWDAFLTDLHAAGRDRRVGAEEVLAALRAHAPAEVDVEALWTRWMVEGHAYEDLLGPAR